jgi:ATP-dependent protease Clp ATPase subunit
LPSKENVKECIISSDVIMKKEKPKLVLKSDNEIKKEKAESA